MLTPKFQNQFIYFNQQHTCPWTRWTYNQQPNLNATTFQNTTHKKYTKKYKIQDQISQIHIQKLVTKW
jgi:hypothetical protein